MNTETTMKSDQTPETVGRKFETVRFAVHSRKAQGRDGAWYGLSRYKSLDEANEQIRAMGNRFTDVGGGLILDTGEATDVYEYRIVKMICQCEVMHAEYRKV